jgi:hypothetical protein
MQSVVLYVSPKGNDQWSGRYAAPTADGRDGPLATLNKARAYVRQLRAAAQFEVPVEVRISGRQVLKQPFVLGPEDSRVTYTSAPGERGVIDAGIRIDGWREQKVNGVRAWVADASEAMQRAGYFHSLFVHDGEQSFRAVRPRLPKEGWFWMDDVPGTPKEEWNNRAPLQKLRFKVKPGDVQGWRNLTDIDVVVLHWWIEDRRPIATFDPDTRMVTLAEEMLFILVDDLNPQYARYYVENVFEAMTEPGQWYLDRQTRQVYYVPRPGQQIGKTELFAGCIEQAVKIEGSADAGRHVDGVTFEGLTIEHGDWKEPNRSGQAAYNVPAFVTLRAARNCRIEDCRIQHAGLWAVEIAEGCTQNRVTGCTITDIGGGGVKVNGSDAHGPMARRTGNSRITDNVIRSIGRVHHSATGVLLGHTFGNTLAHNEIADGYYTGVSVGFVWGYGPSVARDNRVEKNHIHHMGQGWLNDMGGIYLLGIQPGGILRGNVIHDVVGTKYGGWGIYPDEGCSHVVIENNIVYNTASQLFHLHFGRELAVRNNIWAFGKEGLIAISRGCNCNWPDKGVFPDGYNSCCFTFERNVVVTDGQPVFIGGMDDETGNLETGSFISDLNVFWDIGGKELTCGNAGHLMAEKGLRQKFTWDQWLAMGNDAHSLVADPKLRDVRGGDFAMAADSPAAKVGFKPIDISDVGPRPKDKRPAERTDMRPEPAMALL